MGRGRIALLGFVLDAALGLALLMLAGTATEAGSRLEGSERGCVEAALGAYLAVDDELEVTGQGERELHLVGDVVRADGRGVAAGRRDGLRLPRRHDLAPRPDVARPPIYRIDATGSLASAYGSPVAGVEGAWGAVAIGLVRVAGQPADALLAVLLVVWRAANEVLLEAWERAPRAPTAEPRTHVAT